MFLLLILGTLGTSFSSSTPGRDPCLMVCEHFTADRRGNGYDLCDSPILSRCSHTTCRHLYWGRDENNERGLIYSVNGERPRLSLREQTNSLTCEQARELVDWVPEWSFFDSALEVFIRLPAIRPIVEGNEPTRSDFVHALRRHEISSPIVREYLTSTGDNPLYFGDLTSFDALDLLTRIRFPNRSPENYQIIPLVTATCPSCNSTWREPNMPMRHFRSRFPYIIRPHIDLEEALVNGTHWAERRRCRNCNELATMSFERRIQNIPELLILHHPRYPDGVREFIDAEYTFPMELNLSRAYPSFPGENPMYQLIATLHRTSTGPHFYSEFVVDGQWYRHDQGTHLAIVKSLNSTTVETFVYRKL